MPGDLTLNALDEKILLMADHNSPEEISRALGGVVSPARVRLRKDELLRSRGWLSEAEEDLIVIWKMRRLLGSLEESYFKGDLASVKIQLELLKEISKQLDRRKAATETDLQTYNQNVGRQIGRVVDMALTYMKGALREEVDPARWDELVTDALSMAWTEIEKKQVEG